MMQVKVKAQTDGRTDEQKERKNDTPLFFKF